MSLTSVIKYSVYTIGGGLFLYAFLPPSEDLPARDPARNDSQRLLVLQHMKKAAESNATLPRKGIEINPLPDNILKRQEARQDSQKTRDDSPSQADVFRDTFREKQIEIETTLDSVEKLSDRLELADVFDKVAKDITQLSRYLASSSIFLIPYDIKMSKSAIQSLQDRSAELESKYLPRKRFTFKNRRDTKAASDKKVENKEKVAEKTHVTLPSNAFVVSGRTDEMIVIKHEDIKNMDVMLSALKNCYVFVHGAPNTLHLVDLIACKVVSGPVVTSVLVENVSSSACAFPCQQLRIHNTRATDFHVHVTTRAIIEDTTDVRFAPYDYFYDGLGDHYDAAGLDRAVNNWDDVDDFNWLVSNKKSPNWTTIPEDDRPSFLEDLKSRLETLSS